MIPYDAFFVKSHHGRCRMLIYKCHKFTLRNRLKASLSWTCCKLKHGCPCRVFTTLIGRFIRMKNFHNHLPTWKGLCQGEEKYKFAIDCHEFLAAYEIPEKLDWVLIYFTKLKDNWYRCNVCQESLETQANKKLELLEHIKEAHKEIFDLHKGNPDETVGFRIEFLQLNMLNEDESTKVVETQEEEYEHQEIQLTEEPQTLGAEDENMEFVMMPVKKPPQRRVSLPSTPESRKRSWVWKYFQNLNEITFRCNLCNVILSIKGSNTNNMNRHVKSKHPTIYKEEMAQTHYVRRKTCVEIPPTDVACEVVIPETKEGCAAMTLKKDTAKVPRRSWIWSYFIRTSATHAECKLCSRKINHGGNATGNMNRHLKFLHKDVYVNSATDAEKPSEDTSWIWKLFTDDEENYYGCKICNFKCLKFNNMDKTITFIFDHLKIEHGVISGDQIISGPDCEESTEIEECSVAVDFLKGSEESEEVLG